MINRFFGTTEVELDIDPAEFAGMPTDEVVDAITTMLEEEYPDVDVNYEDVVLAAVRVTECES